MRSVGNRSFKELEQAYEANRFQFIVTELDLAITFAETAMSSASDEKTDRNIRHAKRAYQAATKFLKNSSFTPKMTETVAEKMNRVHLLLKRFQ